MKNSNDLSRSLHIVGVMCGLAAGAWLGSAEAPAELVTKGISPIIISAMMVLGVFVARWTVPTLLKGTSYVFADIKSMSHLIIWAIIAGALWAVANTLTIFAIRDIGLAIAFPIWNSNCLVGLFWGCILFNELRGASKIQWLKVLGGAIIIVIATIILGFASMKQTGMGTDKLHGIFAALGAGLLWGTMYVPYRKAYISGMNPLSFVTVFTVGEVLTMSIISVTFMGGTTPLFAALESSLPSLFWLFLGGFCWVIGDLFQQFAAKYIGIGRGIPLANTNQLWGLAWAALVFGDLELQSTGVIVAIVGGSLLMIAGAAAISTAQASSEEKISWDNAIERECKKYNLDKDRVYASSRGEDTLAKKTGKHRWWDYLIIAFATSIFIILGIYSKRPPLNIDVFWLCIILIAALGVLIASAVLLRRKTGFS